MANLQDAARRMYAAKGSLSTSAGDEAKKITTENQLKEDPDKQKDPFRLMDLLGELTGNTFNNTTNESANNEKSDTEKQAVKDVNTVVNNINTRYSKENMDKIQDRGVGVGPNKFK